MAGDRSRLNVYSKPDAEPMPKKTWVTRSISIISAVGWFMALVMLAILDMAKPREANIFQRLLNIPVRTAWNSALLKTALGTLVGVALVCGLGFALNAFYYKRKADSFNRSIIALGVLSLIGVAVFMWRFWELL